MNSIIYTEGGKGKRKRVEKSPTEKARGKKKV